MPEGEIANEEEAPVASEPPPESEGTPARDGRESVWHKNWEIRAAIAGAVISVVGGGIVTLVDHASSEQSESSHPATVATVGNHPPGNPGGSISRVAVKAGSLGLTVSGRSDPGIQMVVVLVGPRSDREAQFWAASSAVNDDGTWSLGVDTPPTLRSPFNVDAFFKTDSFIEGNDRSGPAGLAIPDGGLDCLQISGAHCFNSVGPAATYVGSATYPDGY